MGVFLLINSLLFVVISLVFFIYSLKFIYRKKDITISIPLLGIGIAYLCYAAFSYLCSTQRLLCTSTDLLTYFSIVVLIQTVSLFVITYSLTKNKKMFYLLLLLPIFIPLAILDVKFLVISTPISYLLAMVLLASFFPEFYFDKSRNYMILYLTVSIILYSLTLLNETFIDVFFAASSLLFFAASLTFLRQMGLDHSKKIISIKEDESPVLKTIKHFLFVVILANFIFVGTATVHELGHFAVAKYYGCDDIRIVYEGDGVPHTEIYCDTINVQIALLGGILAPVLLSVLLFFSGGTFIAEMAVMITGINLFISYRDFLELGLGQAAAVTIQISGIILFIASIVLLAKSRIEKKIEQDFLKL